jgi:hypothetical protein
MDEKERKIFLIYKEIQKGAVGASSDMSKYLRISSYIRSSSSYMTLQPLHSDIFLFFFINEYLAALTKYMTWLSNF